MLLHVLLMKHVCGHLIWRWRFSRGGCDKRRWRGIWSAECAWLGAGRASRTLHSISATCRSKGSPRTPSNKPSEILIQFYHLLYSWSTAYFFENIKSNTIGKAWMKKNWALLSRLHITTRVFILPVVSGDFFFSGCCSSIIRYKESCSTVYLPTKSFGGFLKFIYARFRRTICFWN